LIAFTALILGLIAIGRQTYRTAAEPLRGLALGILGSFGVYLGFGLFDSLPLWIKPGFLPWLIFGLVVVCWRLSPAGQTVQAGESDIAVVVN
jgi:hypothetical protein